MKKVLLQYAAYNVWANQRIVDCINNLPDDQIKQEINSSFRSIYATILHLWDVESIWWQRMKLTEVVIWPGKEFDGSIMELTANLLKQSKHWKEWIDLATESVLDHEFIYRNSKKEQYKQPMNEVLLHLFNHQTFHRGQIVTMLRQVGLEVIPNTDFISFCRKK